jgi:hypothetical protein
MAISSATYSYDIVRQPSVDLTVEVLDTTGQTFYTAVVNILELAPDRSTTAEERTAGISSIDPPTVRSQTPQDLINLAIRACGSSLGNTPGVELTPDLYASLAYSVALAVSGALNLAGVDS